ncbi:MAG: hypothetical protein M3112_07710 [Actinomycetia bacterium]|nr:hypothetical protein [Actinomycetes bacterium]
MRRMVAIFVIGLLMGTVIVVSVALLRPTAPMPEKIDMIVMPHPDDEMEAWSVIENNTDVYHLFVYLTLGEETSFCTPDLPGYQEATGEREPRPMPEGKHSEACESERINSTLHFLNQMAETDPGLPHGFTESTMRWSDPFAENGVQLTRSDGDARAPADRRARVFDGGEQGQVVFFDMGDGDLTEDETRWVIDTVLANRTALGIPDLRWNRLIGASFYHDSTYEDCMDYPHPDHKSVHRTVWDDNAGAFSEWIVPTCRQDPESTRDGVVDHFGDAMELGEPTADGYFSRLGSHNIHYGWLKSPYYEGDWEGQEKLFQRNQNFRVRSS